MKASKATNLPELVDGEQGGLAELVRVEGLAGGEELGEGAEGDEPFARLFGM